MGRDGVPRGRQEGIEGRDRGVGVDVVGRRRSADVADSIFADGIEKVADLVIALRRTNAAARAGSIRWCEKNERKAAPRCPASSLAFRVEEVNKKLTFFELSFPLQLEST